MSDITENFTTGITDESGHIYIKRCLTDEERKQRKSESRKRWYRRNKEKIRQYNKKYYNSKKIKKDVEEN